MVISAPKTSPNRRPRRLIGCGDWPGVLRGGRTLPPRLRNTCKGGWGQRCRVGGRNGQRWVGAEVQRCRVGGEKVWRSVVGHALMRRHPTESHPRRTLVEGRRVCVRERETRGSGVCVWEGEARGRSVEHLGRRTKGVFVRERETRGSGVCVRPGGGPLSNLVGNGKG